MLLDGGGLLCVKKPLIADPSPPEALGEKGERVLRSSFQSALRRDKPDGGGNRIVNCEGLAVSHRCRRDEPDGGGREKRVR
jgi:hypothetical protein